jgi:uncharacterized protein (DUF1800 family)
MGAIGFPTDGTKVSPAALDSARHVLDRLAFGPVPGQAELIAREGVMKWIDRQLASSDVDDPALQPTLAKYRLLSTSSEDLLRQFVMVRQERRQEQRSRPDSMMAPGQRRPPQSGEGQELRRLLGQLPQLVIVRAVGSDRQLGEVMADFWFNHFNVFAGKGLDRVYLPEYLERTIRPNALGRFRELLVATATSPAMMFYLDNAQSVAPGSQPPGVGRRMMAQRQQVQARMPTGINENYARELLELHTLGVNGGYTQKDVTEAARILTGWSIAPPAAARAGLRRAREPEAGFQYHEWAHDRGAKTVLGVEFPAGRSQDEGMRLLGMLADHPSTMHFVSAKLCARFINDVPPDGCMDDAVRAWKKSDGNIREVLRAIYQSPDFWAPVHRAAKVKTPLEFVVSAVRAVGGIPDSTPRLALAVGRLGQPLFQHVAPNGYGERQDDWVNSGALLNRMNFAMGLAAGRLPGVIVDLNRVLPASADHQALVASVDRVILNGRMSDKTRQVILEQTADLADPIMARAVAVGLAIGGPEFQRQ